MQEYAEPLQRLIEQFRRLPGIGGKSAVRMAFAVLSFSDEEAEAFADAVTDAKRSIRSCRVCGNFSTGDVCPICADPERERSVVCVVENARDILAFERVREYRGLYHVLGGALSPVNGVTPDAIRLRELVERVAEGELREIIVATDSQTITLKHEAHSRALFAEGGVAAAKFLAGKPAGMYNMKSMLAE